MLVPPSRTTPAWAEQFGHVLIEAMAAGVPPAVGSALGAIAEVVGDAGLPVPEGDVEALRALVGDGALRQTLIAWGRARVDRAYTHAVIARAQRAI